jgi:hypothetical protein
MKKKKSANRAGWDSLLLTHKLYSALAQEFSIELSSCSELESAAAEGSGPAIAAAQNWLAEADRQIQVHQLRQFLQTSPLADETALRAVLAYALHKTEHSAADRDKIDFLLVQFFSVCAPSLLEDSDLTFEFVAKTLTPALGAASLTPLASLDGLEGVIQTANSCHKLQELFDSGVIEKGRELKLAAAHNYFEAAALVSFTRFNFLMRRCFFRAMHRDLNAILDGLRALEQQGVETLDCRGATLSGEESVGRLRMICQSWKAMFQAEYSFGQPLRMLVDLRAAVDAALAGKGSAAAEKAPPAEAVTGETAQAEDSAPRAMAAAASGDANATSAEETSSSKETKA